MKYQRQGAQANMIMKWLMAAVQKKDTPNSSRCCHELPNAGWPVPARIIAGRKATNKPAGQGPAR